MGMIARAQGALYHGFPDPDLDELAQHTVPAWNFLDDDPRGFGPLWLAQIIDDVSRALCFWGSEYEARDDCDKFLFDVVHIDVQTLLSQLGGELAYLLLSEARTP